MPNKPTPELLNCYDCFCNKHRPFLSLSISIQYGDLWIILKACHKGVDDYKQRIWSFLACNIIGSVHERVSSNKLKKQSTIFCMELITIFHQVTTFRHLYSKYLVICFHFSQNFFYDNAIQTSFLSIKWLTTLLRHHYGKMRGAPPPRHWRTLWHLLQYEYDI